MTENYEKTMARPDAEAGTVIGPKSKVSAGVVAVFIMGWLAWVTSELNTIKSTVVARAENVIILQGKVDVLNEKFENLAKHGSEPMARIYDELSRIREQNAKVAEELRVHIIKTSKETPP